MVVLKVKVIIRIWMRKIKERPVKSISYSGTFEIP